MNRRLLLAATMLLLPPVAALAQNRTPRNFVSRYCPTRTRRR